MSGDMITPTLPVYQPSTAKATMKIGMVRCIDLALLPGPLHSARAPIKCSMSFTAKASIRMFCTFEVNPRPMQVLNEVVPTVECSVLLRLVCAFSVTV